MKSYPEWQKRWESHLAPERRRQGAEEWLEEHEGEIEPVIEKPETGIPDAMRAETLQFLVFERGRYQMPDIRVFPWLLLLVGVRCSRQEVIARDIANAPVYERDEYFYRLDESLSAIQWRLFPYAFGLLPSSSIIRLALHVDFDRRPVKSPAVGDKESKRAVQNRAHRLLYPLTGPHGIRRETHYNPFPRQRLHTRAGHKAEEIGKHRCPPLCQCQQDWRIWQHWRPWVDPFFLRPALAAKWEEMWPHVKTLNLYLTRIRWVYRGREPELITGRYKDWRSVLYYSHIRAGFDVLMNVTGALPWHARYWEYFFHSAKVRQIEDSPGDFLSEIKVRLFEHLELVAIPGRGYVGICVDLDHTIIRRKVRVKKVPGYKLHDSAGAVMSYLGCSRATAFRRIKAGFRIPE